MWERSSGNTRTNKKLCENRSVRSICDDDRDMEEISNYWASIRPIYAKFESDLRSGTTEIYRYEIPGGQYSNLKPQIESFGLVHKFNEVKEMYKKVNDMLGDIIKVTPSSKMVGDMAIFMVQNGLTPENILEQGKNLDYPDSVISYFKGMMGQPEGGFPPELQKLVLKGEKPIRVRPGELLDDVDFPAIKEEMKNKLNINPTDEDVLSYILYPKVFKEYIEKIRESGDMSNISSDIFFHGIKVGQSVNIDIDEGKTLVVKLVNIGELSSTGHRNLTFEVNGFRRDIQIEDKNANIKSTQINSTMMADSSDPSEIGASIPGKIVQIRVAVGDEISEGNSIMIIEAMKMETNVVATKAGTVKAIFVSEGEDVQSGQLLIKLET